MATGVSLIVDKMSLFSLIFCSGRGDRCANGWFSNVWIKKNQLNNIFFSEFSFLVGQGVSGVKGN